MNSTALGATGKQESGIIFVNDAHEKFYYEKLKKMQYQDEYHMALCYCLGISDDTRRNIDRIYDFETGCVKPACLYEGWQTSASKKIVRMAFNLYCNGTPSVHQDVLCIFQNLLIYSYKYITRKEELIVNLKWLSVQCMDVVAKNYLRQS